jgi:hypothetical protein
VVEFLKERGFDQKDIAVQPPGIHDTSTEKREKDVPPPPVRFSADQSVLLRTAKVDAIKPALASASNLIRESAMGFIIGLRYGRYTTAMNNHTWFDAIRWLGAAVLLVAYALVRPGNWKEIRAFAEFNFDVSLGMKRKVRKGEAG